MMKKLNKTLGEEKMPVPERHRKILDDRLADYRAGRTKPIAHDELMRRLRKP